MTKTELVKHLGVVASSGTTKFVEAAKNGADALSLIGQFGVGFYSVYLVANHVTVVSKSNDDPVQHVWQSSANQVFTVTEDPRGNTLGRGTEVILHLKDDATEFLDQSTLERIVTKYSSFINFPIFLETTKSVEKEVPVEEEKKAEETKEEADKPKDDVEVSDDDKKDEEKKPATKKVRVDEKEWKQLNENKAIWTRKPK
jgi:heat shock protein beta